MTSARDRNVKPGAAHGTESRRSNSVLLNPLAIPAHKRVLARDPKNTEALTHVGLVLYSANHVDQALARIDEALRIDPAYAHAHWDRANILYETKKDPAEIRRSGATAER
jgi:lipoprotein NlpI